MENTNQITLFNPKNTQATIKSLSNFEDAIKNKVYSNLEEIATAIINEDRAVETFNENLDEMNKAEIAHNLEVKERYSAKRAEHNAISTVEEFNLLDATSKANVQDVKVITRTTSEGQEETSYLYELQNGQWRDIEDLVSAKGSQKMERAKSLILEILAKREIASNLQKEADAIYREVKPLPFTRKSLDLSQYQELAQALDNDIVKEQLKGDYLSFFKHLIEGSKASIIKFANIILGNEE